MEIINHKTINYEDNYYCRLTFYNGAGDSNSSDQFRTNSTTSSMFDLRQGSYSYSIDQNDNDAY